MDKIKMNKKKFVKKFVKKTNSDSKEQKKTVQGMAALKKWFGDDVSECSESSEQEDENWSMIKRKKKNSEKIKKRRKKR